MSAGLMSFTVLGALSVVLLMVHVLLQSSTATKELGRAWNAGPRDTDIKPKSPIAGRAKRASENFRETYPAFIVLLMGLAVGGDWGNLGFTGVLVWYAGRIVYIPLYLRGIPYIRSLAWLVAMLGLLLMAAAVVLTAL
ncbi:MAPEG family protein [Rhizobium sp.]